MNCWIAGLQFDDLFKMSSLLKIKVIADTIIIYCYYCTTISNSIGKNEDEPLTVNFFGRVVR